MAGPRLEAGGKCGDNGLIPCPSRVEDLAQTDPTGEGCWNCLCQTALGSAGRTWEQVAFSCLPAKTSNLTAARDSWTPSSRWGPPPSHPMAAPAPFITRNRAEPGGAWRLWEDMDRLAVGPEEPGGGHGPQAEELWFLLQRGASSGSKPGKEPVWGFLTSECVGGKACGSPKALGTHC